MGGLGRVDERVVEREIERNEREGRKGDRLREVHTHR